LKKHQKHFAKGNGNQNVKKCPHRAKKPGGWRPGWFY